MTSPRRKTVFMPRRSACNLAALAALGLLVSAGPVLAATAGTTLTQGTVPIIKGVVSQKTGGYTYTQGTDATIDVSPIKSGGVDTGNKILTVNQLVSKLVLDWNSFDLANGSTVQFIQPSSSSAVLNRIHDANPSTIEGNLIANGQVYLVNQNGILFNRGSTINVGSLFASTLNVTGDAWDKGITSGGAVSGHITYAAFSGGYDGVTNPTAAVTIGGGSSDAAAPTITTATGGAIVIVAPVIDNRSGILKSPDGQVILAAGSSAYLGFSDSNNAAMRGMLVEVTAPSSGDVNLSSYIRNAGTISADRGNVTLAGLAINQEGRVSATSAMLTNGSIWLQGRTLNGAQQGKVTLAAGSVTETPLDSSDTSTMHQSDDWTQYRPVVKLEGAHIDVEGSIVSPSGNVSFNAKADPNTSGDVARIYLGSGSSVDASGAWSTADDSSNLLTFKVTSNELADSPDQKGGLLLGKTVTVDLRQSSTILNLSGYQDAQARTLAQKAAAGGVVTFTTTGDFVEHGGATVNVSGGGVHYTGATESTTKLLGADGKLYDIMSAPEQLAYTQIASSYVDKQAKWGYSKTYSNLLSGASIKRPDYTEGAAGGSLAIATTGAVSGVVMDGDNLGGVTIGSQQLAAAPRGATLTVGSSSALSVQQYGVGDITFMPGAVTTLAAGFTATSALSDSSKSLLQLSTDVFSSFTAGSGDTTVSTGFGTVNLYANGRVTVPESVTLAGPTGGSLTVNANQIEVDGKISVPAGTVSLINASTVGTASSPATTSNIMVAQSGSIDTRGTWTNNYLTGQTAIAPTAVLAVDGKTAVSTIKGGSITLDAVDLDLASGSVLDVTGGGVVSTKGVATGGDGGSISLSASDSTTTHAMTLGGTLRGEGFANGGALSITTSGTAQIGGTAASTVGLALDTTAFTSGGFGSYSVSSAGDLTVAASTTLELQQQNLQFYDRLAQALPTGGDVTTVATFSALPDYSRHATNLSLASTAGKLTVKSNAGIDGDAGAAVSLSGVTGVSIGGWVYAPGGTINVSLNAAASATPPTLELTSTGLLSTRAVFVQKPSDTGLMQGALWNAGSLNLAASKGKIALDAGSVINVSGTSQVVDQATAVGASEPYAKVTQYANAGTLSITGNDAIALGGTLNGSASGTAAGGSFALTYNERGDSVDPSSKRRIVVSQNGTASFTAPDTDKEVAISAAKLSGSGFDKLRLTAEDQIVFADSAALSFARGVTLDTQSIQVASGASALVTGANVKLADSYGLRVRNDTQSTTDLSSTMDKSQATALQATAAGTGLLAVKADTIDVTGSVTLSGVRSTTLSATHDLRLSGRVIGDASSTTGATLQGSLTTAGDLTLKAAQVYPTTASNFTIALADGLTGATATGATLTIASSGATRGDVYSAGGSLTLTADHIQQNGVVKAPLGSITVKAGTDLTLASGSITSVSSDGLTTLYGETQSGVTWTYGATGSNAQTTALTGLPTKQVKLDAPSVDVKSGATVDISGGGDVAAIEFVAGSGGSKDVLAQANTYAIIPAANLSAAPIDPDIARSISLGTDKDGAVYNTIHIGAGGAVPAGDYVLLPGYYALLKGAYMVQVLTGSSYTNLQAGQTTKLANGQTVIAGRLEAEGTAVAAATTVGVVLTPGSGISRLADYTVTNSSYFATLASKNNTATPLLPTDAGNLTIAATQHLALDGTLAAALPTTTSRSAEVDIAADKIAVVDTVGRTDIASDYLQIDAGSLSKLDASLLLGGTRRTDASGLVLTPQASDIVVANSASAPLKAPEVILAATDAISVRSGSVVDASGTRASTAQDITVAGSGASSGAIVRAANSGLASITRSSVDTSRGSVTVESGATLSASGSLTLDATGNTRSAGTLAVAAGGGLSLVSGSLALGDTDALAGLQSGLVLDNAQLAAFADLGTLSLKSYGAIAIYGNTQVGASTLKNLVIDGASLIGRASASGDAAAATFSGTQVTLQDTSGATATALPADANAGALVVNAGTITLGAGDKTISGFSGVQFNSTGEILAAGTGSLTTLGTLDLAAARIASVSGATQAWSARDGLGADAGYDAVTIRAVTPATALADSTAVGSRLTIAGSTISDSGTIAMKAGAVTLQAQGNVSLNAGATIDAGGATKDFQGTKATADAGQVTLASAQGDVRIAQGATVNVSASGDGGDAGSISVQAQSLDLQGKLTGASGRGTSGRFTLDLGNADATKALDLSALNAALDLGSFTESRDIRVRNGDLVVGAADTIHAHHLVLESDQGTVSVQGRLDASTNQGAGSIEVYGASVNVASGAVIDASATSTAKGSGTAAANGGKVTLAAETGTLTFAAGAKIDVRSGETGDAGSVLLRAPRSTNSLRATLDGQVLSQRRDDSTTAEVDIEGNRVYAVTGGTITDSMIAGYGADNTTWVNSVNAGLLTANLRGDGGTLTNVHVRPSVEVQAAGDLTIASGWDLTGTGWSLPSISGTGKEAGSLLVRAGGDLTLQSVSLGNPDYNLPTVPTWNIALTSGADLTAANGARNQSAQQLSAQVATGTGGAGDLVLDSRDGEASVRTGTGDIRLSAGHDFVIKAGTDAGTGDAVVGVVYAAGKAAITDPFMPGGEERFTGGGGDVTITAAHDAIGAGNEWITDWFRYATDGTGGLDKGAWWSSRQTFHDGVAAFGGGNVSIEAGHDILNLSAFAPTSAIRDNSGDAVQLQTWGGGNLALKAGNDILGGQYLVSLGQGSLRAGRDIGSSTVQGLDLYLMGASGVGQPAQAGMTLVAGRSAAVADIDNPTRLFLTSYNDLVTDDPSFLYGTTLPMISYSTNSSASIVALSGDVSLGSVPELRPTLEDSQQSAIQARLERAVYPAQVSVAAFGGDIAATNGALAGSYSATMFPSESSRLKLLAAGDISNMSIFVSDADPSLFAIGAVSDTLAIDWTTLLSTGSGAARVTKNSSTDSFVYDVVAQGGDIVNPLFSLPERSRLWAGGSIVNATLNLQNTAATDTSEVVANTGSISRSSLGLGEQGIHGPGSLLLQAGKDIDMGTQPFYSDGNALNSSLKDPSGATVTLLAGVTGLIDLTKLDKAFDAIEAAGKSGNKDAARKAVDDLFTGTTIGQGNIDSYNTSIQSTAGAGLNLLAPGGNITVGLTTQSDKNIGLLTTAGGAIRSYLSGDFDINRGKVITAQGGDILIYTRDGSIDAGKGAHTSSTTPPPTRKPVYDPGTGALTGYTYTLPVAVSGSGIQTLTSKPGGPTSVAPKAGDIYLFAPSGSIDAGEAGIASSGNIFIIALTVLNADNISAAGTSSGVPQVAVGSLASSLASSGATNATGTSPAADAAAAAAAAASNAPNFKPAILTVEVLGFGDKNCRETDKDCFAK